MAFVQRPHAQQLVSGRRILRSIAITFLLALMVPGASFAQTIRGVVFDSLLTRRPLAGAEVWSPTLGQTVTADNAGRFSFDVTAPGPDTVELSVYHPLLERMAIPSPKAKVPVKALGGEAPVIGVPSVETLRRLTCGAAADSDAALVIGRVAGVPADGGTVRVEAQWEALTTVGTAVERRMRSSRADVRGQTYWLCGAPLVTPFAIVAQVADGPATIVRVGATSEPFVVRHLAAVVAPDSTRAASESWVLTGRIVSRLGDPVANAEVAVTGRAGRTRTAADGAFAASLDAAGRREISVRAVGYEPAVVSLYLSPRQRELPEIVLERTVQILAEREIKAGVSGFRGFEYRRRTGQGYYMTREQIEKRKAMTASQLFTGIPHVWVQQSGTVAIRRSEGQIGLKNPGGCLPVYYIDGVPREIPMPMFTGVMPPDLGPNNFVVPSEIEAIEVYRGLGSIPVEFKRLDAGCGVIVIWTRRGLDAREPAPPK